MKLNKNKLRRIILEEIKKINDAFYYGKDSPSESLVADDPEHPFDFSKRDKVGGDELFEDDKEKLDERGMGWDARNKWDDIHHAEDLRDDERDEFRHHDYGAAEEDKHHEDDLYYDAHDDKRGQEHEDAAWLRHRLKEIKKTNEKLDTEQLHYTPTLEEENVDEVVSVDSTDDNDPGWNAMSAADTQAAEEKEEGPLNIGESTEGLSRGSLYRRRYYGRY